MDRLYPFTFDPDELTQDQLWGGSKLKHLVPGYPNHQPLAELWVVSDRPEDDRVGRIANGPLAGTTLRDLMEHRSTELLGKVAPVDGKFPLLIKFLDAKQRLSLQVHPPVELAAVLGGEPKTECWTMLEGTDSGAAIIAGLKPDVTQAQFESTLRSGGDLEPLLHTIQPQPGECMFLPSGRLHAIDAGCLIYEVQQNSNTTYRVFDWNRVDARTQQPRALHVEQALQSIDFTDVEPTLQQPVRRQESGSVVETLVDCPYFTLERWTTNQMQTYNPSINGSFDVITVLNGNATITANGQPVDLGEFGTALLPAALEHHELRPSGEVTYLRTYVRT